MSMSKLLRLNIQFFADEKGISADSLKNLQTDFTKNWTELKGLLDTQADEVRANGETATLTATNIKAVETTISKLETDLKGVTDQFKEMETKFNRPNFGATPEFKTAGERFVESDSYKNMVQAGMKSSAPFEIGSFHKIFQKDLSSVTAAGGILVTPQVMPGINTPLQRQLHMRDLLNVQRTTSNAIEFIKETGFTNASAPVAEKILKPESNLTFSQETATVKTLAHFIPATRQIIDDAVQLQNYVDNRLIYGLKLTEETQILFGSGVGENIQGLMTHTGVQNAGIRGANTHLDHIRKSITLATVAGYPVTGIILAPVDWEAIELQKGTDNHYIWVSVPDGGATRLWRVPVVESLSMTAGSFLLGAFGLGAQIWDREDANVRVSEHHSDFFIRNQIAILAEERLAMTVYRPESFVKGTFATA